MCFRDVGSKVARHLSSLQAAPIGNCKAIQAVLAAGSCKSCECRMHQKRFLKSTEKKMCFSRQKESSNIQLVCFALRRSSSNSSNSKLSISVVQRHGKLQVRRRPRRHRKQPQRLRSRRQKHRQPKPRPQRTSRSLKLLPLKPSSRRSKRKERDSQRRAPRLPARLPRAQLLAILVHLRRLRHQQLGSLELRTVTDALLSHSQLRKRRSQSPRRRPRSMRQSSHHTKPKCPNHLRRKAPPAPAQAQAIAARRRDEERAEERRREEETRRENQKRAQEEAAKKKEKEKDREKEKELKEHKDSKARRSEQQERVSATKAPPSQPPTVPPAPAKAPPQAQPSQLPTQPPTLPPAAPPMQTQPVPPTTVPLNSVNSVWMDNKSPSDFMSQPSGMLQEESSSMPLPPPPSIPPPPAPSKAAPIKPKAISPMSPAPAQDMGERGAVRAPPGIDLGLLLTGPAPGLSPQPVRPPPGIAPYAPDPGSLAPAEAAAVSAVQGLGTDSFFGTPGLDFGNLGAIGLPPGIGPGMPGPKQPQRLQQPGSSSSGMQDECWGLRVTRHVRSPSRPIARTSLILRWIAWACSTSPERTPLCSLHPSACLAQLEVAKQGLHARSGHSRF